MKTPIIKKYFLRYFVLDSFRCNFAISQQDKILTITVGKTRRGEQVNGAIGDYRAAILRGKPIDGNRPNFSGEKK